MWLHFGLEKAVIESCNGKIEGSNESLLKAGCLEK